MSKSSSNCAIAYFVAGIGFGILATLLFAPQSGEETRKMISRKAEQGRDYLAVQGKTLRREAENLRVASRRAVEDLVEEGKDFVSRVKL
ncbi:MAG TPA: YtxH domain-containing protein [Terriglobia bacterium]|nr:YtxH domain-containing protein [Terriglobia bacterium]